MSTTSFCEQGFSFFEITVNQKR